MTKIKKFCAFVLVLMLVISAGIMTVNAAEQTAEEVAASAAESGITIHYQNEDLAQPYVYLWISLPTNRAMSDSYHGEKMTTTGNGWYDYTCKDITKVNMIFTDAEGKQYSKELTRTTGEWWYRNNRWTAFNPDEVIPTSSNDMREETLYFVMTTRFYDGETGNNVHCWDDTQANNPDSDPAWRGDFQGLIDKLDYI